MSASGLLCIGIGPSRAVAPDLRNVFRTPYYVSNLFVNYIAYQSTEMVGFMIFA